jgi:hypothetical protein
MMAGRYAHAKQFKRHRRELRILRSRLGRIIRDIRRKIAGQADIEAGFQWPLARANQILCVPKTPSRIDWEGNRLTSAHNDRAVMFYPGRRGLAIQVEEPA